MKPALAATAATLSLLALAAGACTHPPRLDFDRANRERAVVSTRTPRDEHSIEAEVAGERRSLAKWAKRAAPGDTIEVKLGPGVWVIDDPIVVRGVSLVIAGSGVEKTRIKLDSDDWRALSIHDCPSFELRGVTVAAFSGGGIDVHNTARVVVNECDFVGGRYGLELDSSTAIVDSCVFAGNEQALVLAGAGSTLLRGTCFAGNWWTIKGAGQLTALGCAFLGSEKGADLLCAPGSVLRSVLFAQGENFVTPGRPRFESSLFGPDDLLDRYARRGSDTENKPLGEVNDFPNALAYGLPPGCQVGAIHYALGRYRLRGSPDLYARIDDVLRTEAELYAQGARRAVASKKLGAARELARLAHTYIVALAPNASRAGFEDVEALLSVSQ